MKGLNSAPAPAARPAGLPCSAGLFNGFKCMYPQSLVSRARQRAHVEASPSRGSVTACSNKSTADAPAAAPPHRTSFHHGITYTSYECNTFALKFNTSGVRVLADPWLVGDLTFFQQDWLFRGKKRALNNTVRVDINQLAEETDVLLLTMEIDDHTHMPTLERFPRSVAVVANAAAAERIRPLGFQNVTVVAHGQTKPVCGGKLQVTATAGALVGPPWSTRANGYVLREVAPSPQEGPGASLYYEPHCDYVESSVRAAGPVDVVVSPVMTQSLGVNGVAYPLVMGADANLERLLRVLRPKVLLPLLNAEIDQEGPLAPYIIDRGSYDGLRDRMAAAGLDLRVEFPAPPGEAMAVAL